METQPEKKTREYHPYQHLQIPRQYNLYHLPTTPDFLFEEEAQRPHRAWNENLIYYTGSAYLAGAIVGGAKGTLDGLRAVERGDTLKLRVNRVLNSGGSVGRRFGNYVGVLGLIYGGLESYVTYYRGVDDDSINSFLAGLGTGALYRVASGPRLALIAATIGGVTAFAGIDTTGDVRIPASHCGVIGFRPSHGAVSHMGIIPVSKSLDTVGQLLKHENLGAYLSSKVTSLKAFRNEKEISEAKTSSLKLLANIMQFIQSSC